MGSHQTPNEHQQANAAYIRFIQTVHSKWTPHRAQVTVGKDLIQGLTKEVFAQCGRNWGKALSLETELPTPVGWRKLRDITPGDYVFGADGLPTRVIGESPVYLNRQCYEVVFDDGSKIIADADHNWITTTKLERKRHKGGSKRTTTEIANTLRYGKEANHMVANCKPIQWAEAQLPIPPYTLGAWLGNGRKDQASISQWDDQVLDEIRSDGFDIRAQPSGKHQYGILGLYQLLRQEGLLGNKSVPEAYLTASESQRRALLAGMMDTDGTVSPGGACCFDNTNLNLAQSVKRLVESLGVKATITSRVGKLNGIEHKRCYRVRFSPATQIFRLARKAARIVPHLDKPRRAQRAVLSVTQVPSAPVKCIAVDNESHLYLVGRECIPTHNTDLMVYLMWRYALTYPNSENYYFAPFAKQAREILWASRRLQDFLPKEYIADIGEQQMRLTLHNGSFIKLDGSDNVEAYRGVKPKGLSVFDEFKDFRPEFYEAYDPNRAAHDSPLLIIGTPPDRECQYTALADEFRRNPQKRWYKFPTSANPHISRQWLEDKKAELIARGDLDVWMREYEAEFIKGGKAKIFPMLKESHKWPHEAVIREIKRDRKKLLWYSFADPAAASCFANLMIAINPFNRKVYCLDEIYETDQARMTVKTIGKRIIDQREELYDDPIQWRMGYDEAETWFANEMLDRFEESFEPSQKALNDKESGITLIKDLLLTNQIIISDRCEKLFWELDNYFKDKNGKIPKENDHLIDCLRYCLGADHYTIQGEAQKEIEEEESWHSDKLRMHYSLTGLEGKFGADPNNDDDWG